MKQLKDCQREGVDKLINRVKMFLEEDGNSTITFEAPTGSGKTLMMTNALSELSEKDLKQDIAYIWISIGKGALHEQSYNSFKREMHGDLTCFLLDNSYVKTHNVIRKNEIIFVNWEKINTKDSITNEWTSPLMIGGDDIGFKEILKNTRDENRIIILIIDESHYASDTERALEIRNEIIIPKITIEMSATPKFNYDVKITILPENVMRDELIKKEIVINNEGTSDESELNSQEIVMKRALEKQNELKKLYEAEESIVNPLVLIQIPNSDAGNEKRDFVEQFLIKNGVDESKIAVWLNDETINKEYEKLMPLDGKVEYLIFKQAIDTGWDCPRAHILVKFREISSVIFEIQTVGRILRMPEVKHYKNEQLNKGYVYTNLKSIEVKQDSYNDKILKTVHSHKKYGAKNIILKSYYKSRIKQGTIESQIYEDLKKSFCKYFNLSEDITKNSGNYKKLKSFGIELEDFSDMDSILNNIYVDSSNIDSLVNENIKGDSISSNYSTNDLQNAFEYLIKCNLNGFAPAKSVGIVKEALYKIFFNYLNLKKIRNVYIYIQNVIIKNQDHFSTIINEATSSYKNRYQEIIDSKTEKIVDENWSIPDTVSFNPNTTMIYNGIMSLMQPLYIKKTSKENGNLLEKEFIDYLDEKKDYIEWYWQNGQENITTNFGIEKSDSSVFRPDFIVLFKDRRIGIFDTKGGQFPDDDRIKSNALQKYIKEENKKGKNLIGGIVIFDKSEKCFYLFNKDNYLPYNDENKKKWKKFNTIFQIKN